MTVASTIEETEDRKFDGWEVTNRPAGFTISDEKLAQREFSFIMPAGNVELTAHHSNKLEVSYGTAKVNGNAVDFARPDADVTVTATDRSADGYQFDHWVVSGGDIGKTEEELKANPLKFTMPDAAVKLTAVYRAAVTVVNGIAEAGTESGETIFVLQGEKVTVSGKNRNPDVTKFGGWKVISPEGFELTEEQKNTEESMTFTMPASPVELKGNMELKRILIVEDDADIAAIERDYLELGGYAVTIAPDGTTGLDAALHQPFDLILLDVMLPGIDGFAICKQVRAEKDIPILMVTARGEDVDKIRGLGFGADDYIEKPFSPSVLVARVKAHLAQYARLKPCADTPKTITVGPLTADPAARRITKNGVEVPLKNKEYELLFFLMRHPEQVFSREDLYELIWGLESMGDNITVAVHINRLREKIEDTPADPKLLQTVWGVGYRLHIV